MRAAVLGSIGVHLVLIVGLLVLRGPTPLVVPGPDVMQVSLVSPEAPMVPAQPRLESVRARAIPAVVPEKGEGVKLAPEKPKKVLPREPVEPAPAPAPTLPWARVGSAGLKGEVVVDSHDFEFTYYLMLVRNRIAQNWSPPSMISGGATVHAVAYFQIGREGGVRGLRLETPSAVDYFDRSVMRAVMLSDPLPPLPLGFGGAMLGVHFGFEWGEP